jgi:exopolyphosphatase/guanosine-5'-triphosphate,3'-diphosphate pyrophosphatase
VPAACIDIGSNTTRLLVADRHGGQLIAVHEERAFSRIGHGRRPGEPISAQKIEEVLAAVSSQVATARSLGASAIHVVATAAVRTASNGSELAEGLERCAEVSVRILSEEEEARLAFAGAAAMLDHFPHGQGQSALAVIDVGGGSSEIAIGVPPAEVIWWTSLPLGSGDLTERHLASDPPTSGQLEAARRDVNGHLAGLRPPRTDRAVAVGGSATSLRRLAGPALSAASLARTLELLSSRQAGAIAAEYGIDPQRARLLPAGLVVMQTVASLLGTSLTIGSGGIREGVLLEAERM